MKFSRSSRAMALISLIVAVVSVAVAKDESTVQIREITKTVSVEFSAVAPYGTTDVLAPSSSMTVGRVFVSPGQFVQEGETLLMISNPAARQAYEQAASRLRDARQRLEAARQRYATYLSESEKRLRGARNAVASAHEAMTKAKTAVTVYHARPTTDRYVVTERGTVTVAGSYQAPSRVQVQHRADPSALRAASAQQTAALNELSAAQRAYADARLHVGKSLAPFEHERDQAYAQFRTSQAARKEDQVKAGIAGTVVAVASQGAVLGKGDPMATVVRLEKLVAVTHVAGGNGAALHEGQPVVIQFDNGKALPAKIARIKAIGNVTKVVVDFDNADRAIKPGDHGHVTARVAHAVAVPAIPLGALQSDGTVRVMREGRWQDVAVTTGIDDGRWVAIKSGLSPGEKVSLAPRK